MRCSICHQQANFEPGRMPGHPEWQLAPREMAWEGKTLAEICVQIKDPKRERQPVARGPHPSHRRRHAGRLGLGARLRPPVLRRAPRSRRARLLRRGWKPAPRVPLAGGEDRLRDHAVDSLCAVHDLCDVVVHRDAGNRIGFLTRELGETRPVKKSMVSRTAIFIACPVRCSPITSSASAFRRAATSFMSLRTMNWNVPRSRSRSPSDRLHRVPARVRVASENNAPPTWTGM